MGQLPFPLCLSGSYFFTIPLPGSEKEFTKSTQDHRWLRARCLAPLTRQVAHAQLGVGQSSVLVFRENLCIDHCPMLLQSKFAQELSGLVLNYALDISIRYSNKHTHHHITVH